MKHSLIRYLQKSIFHVGNSFEPRKTQTEPYHSEKYLYWPDVNYGSKYPNGYLDIYTQPDARENRHATLFYVHGGGYTWGDKIEGDPNAKGAETQWFFEAFLNAGYNVVSMNYAFAPEYHYPIPIIQMHEAIGYLKEHAGEHGLDMHQVILCGSSAGGQLVGQFAALQTNSDYADEMGIVPVLQSAELKAILLNSALLDNERFGKTDNAVVSWLFAKCGRAYFNCEQLPGNEQVKQSNVITHATDEFPPAFISDGNFGTFTDQARDLARKLEQIGVDTTVNFHERKEVRLPHGFENRKDTYGLDNMEKMLQFMKKHTT
ncbi:alpha/beta hydrolase [Alloscardovia omnicolens]|uniref:alpha/beta hydrolase n=1 Tax=Alloscardovia omnicolens TaxID=419015 RepID=UPI003A7A94C1